MNNPLAAGVSAENSCRKMSVIDPKRTYLT